MFREYFYVVVVYFFSTRLAHYFSFALVCSLRMDEAIGSRFPVSPPGKRNDDGQKVSSQKMDPPDDEPPSLTKQREGDGAPQLSYEENDGQYPEYYGEGEGPPDPEDPMPMASPEAAHGQGTGDRFFSPGNETYYMSPENADQGEEDQDYDPAHQDYYGTEPTEDDNDRGYMEPGDEYAQNGFPSPHEQFSTPMSDGYGRGGDQYAGDYDAYPTQDRGFSPPGDAKYAPDFSPRDEFATEDFTLPSDGEGERQYGGADPYYGSSEEKKAQEEHGNKTGALTIDTDAEFTPIKREGYKLGPSPSPRSQLSSRSNEAGTPVSQSSALRGAQELLKKNRRRRLEM